MRVLLTDAEQRNTLAAVRSLGSRGVSVDVTGSARFSQAFFSRYCSRRLLFPEPARWEQRFRNCLTREVGSDDYDVLLPMHEYSLLAVVRHADALRHHVAVALPDPETLYQVRDKQRVVELAREVGISAPRTYRPRDRADIDRISREINYPCVMKPRTGMGAIGVGYAQSPSALRRLFRGPRESDAVFDFRALLIQEYIPGEIHDVDVLFCRGEPRAGVTCRRITTYPSTGGRSLICETTDEPELRRAAYRLLRAVGWHGPAEVEFKIDRRDGVPKLMEINPRFSGSLELQINAGADLAYQACRLALLGDVEPIREYTVGLRQRWWFPYELAAVFLDGGAGLGTLMRFEPGTVYSTMMSDPLPHLAQVLDVGGRVLKHLWKSLTARPLRRRAGGRP
jgi:predicted ATP-grasp superfamily ATP-dependent carboligase